jgi:hypothetical protein
VTENGNNEWLDGCVGSHKNLDFASLVKLSAFAYARSALAHHGQLKLCVARRRASCVPPFGMALRALTARFKMAAVNKV